MKNKVRVAEIKMRRSYQFEQYQTQSLEITALVPEHLQTEPHRVCDALLEVLNSQLTRMQQNPPKLVITKDAGLNVSDKLWSGINLSENTEKKEETEKTTKKETVDSTPLKPKRSAPASRPKARRGRPKQETIIDAEQTDTTTNVKPLVTKEMIAESSKESFAPRPDFQPVPDKIMPGDRDQIISDLTDAYYNKVNNLDFEDRIRFLNQVLGEEFNTWDKVIGLQDTNKLNEILTKIKAAKISN